MSLVQLLSEKEYFKSAEKDLPNRKKQIKQERVETKDYIS